MTPEDYAFLEDRLGLQLISQGDYTDSYLAVIDSGELLYEAISNRKIEHDMEVNGQDVSLTSCGWFSGPVASVKIDGKHYANIDRGLDFVVFDKGSGVVIDQVEFDTHVEEKTMRRSNALTLSLFEDYEAAVCFGENAA